MAWKAIPHVLKWDRFGRKGWLCEILPARPGQVTVEIKFQDGVSGIVSRQALRRATEEEIQKGEQHGEGSTRE